MDISRVILDYLLPVAVVVWVVARQFVGRFVRARNPLVLPAILVVIGLAQAARVPWTPLAAAAVAGDLLLVAALGVVRARAIRLSLRDGYLYQSGGWLSVGLWVLTIAVRIGFALPFLHTSAEPALAATLTASFGVSLGVQFAVFNARVTADGRPLRPRSDGRGSDRRDGRMRSTLEQ